MTGFVRVVAIIPYGHSYAVNALQAGDSIKAVQEQLGHYSSSFTMDTYAAVSDTMRKDSQERMEELFRGHFATLEALCHKELRRFFEG